MHLETVTRAGLLGVWAGFSVCSYAGAEAFTQGRGGSSLLARATLLTTTQMLIGAAIFIINTAMDSKVNQLTKKMVFCRKTAIPTFKLIQNAKDGGVLENSGYFLQYGH